MVSAGGTVGLSGQILPYLLPLLATGMLSLGLAGLAWRRRQIPGGPAFAVLMLTIGEWTVGYALELAAPNLSSKLFFDQLEYLGIVANPIAAVAFALHYTARGHWLTPGRLAALALVPVTTLALLWTHPTGGLVQTRVDLDLTGPFPALVISHGPWFWVHVTYSYLLLAIAAALIFESLLRSPLLYRAQIGAMLVGVLTPLLSNAVYVSGLSPVPGLDLTPFAFSVTGLVMFVAFFRLGFLDLFLGLPLVARRILVTHLPDALILVDARGTVVEANSVAVGVLDAPEARVVGRPIEAFFPDWGAWSLHYPAARPHHIEINCGQSGVPRSYDLLRAPVYVEGTHLVGWVLVLREITERKRIEAAREEALAREQAARTQAEEAVRLREDFLSIAAHELRTPVTTLRLASETLLRLVDLGLPSDAPEFRRALLAIDRQSVKLSHQVLQLLDLSRLRSGRLGVSRTRENLGDLVRTVVDQAQARTIRHTLVLTAPAEAIALIDAVRFEQVLTNLLDNAVKYSPNGGQIDIGLELSAPEKISLTVRDRGIGIPTDRREQIFDLFYQAHRESRQSGLGIGLFIARQIVELHGGTITAEFPPDGGTCFRVVLPTGVREGAAS